MKSADMPAAPVTDKDGMPFNDVPKDVCSIGITKREYAAIQIMASFGTDPNCTGPIEQIAGAAVDWADALFEELEKDQ